MYVDKLLSGIKAVQTLSRLNRAHPGKHDTFVLDFQNDADLIQASFEPYYRTTILSSETDPNKLHDLKADLDAYRVYDAATVDRLVELYLSGADRDRLDPLLDGCVAIYLETGSMRIARSTSKARLRRSCVPTASSLLCCRTASLAGRSYPSSSISSSPSYPRRKRRTHRGAFSKRSIWKATGSRCAL